MKNLETIFYLHKVIRTRKQNKNNENEKGGQNYCWYVDDKKRYGYKKPPSVFSVLPGSGHTALISLLDDFKCLIHLQFKLSVKNN